jgi:mRNA interferase MazF
VAGYGLKRGDIVTVVLPGAYGKPRPAVVVQSDRLALDSVIVCPLTSFPVNAGSVRVDVDPGAENGVKIRSQVMVDKVTVLPRSKCSAPIGRLDNDRMQRVDARLALVLGLAG